MKITCCIHSLSGGGAERVMAGLANDLFCRGHDVSLVTYFADDARSLSIEPGVLRACLNLDVTGQTENRTGPRSGIDRIRQIRSRITTLAKVIERQSPDVVLSFCDRMNLDVLLALRGRGLPVMVCERSDPASQGLGLVWNWMRSRLYRQATTVVALTPTAKDYLRRFSNHVIVIPSAIKTPTSYSNREIACANRTIVAAGRLESEKGFDRLITAFARATQGHPDWKLVLYGDGSLRRQLQRQATELGINDRFEMPGWVRPLQPHLAEATIFCLSSHYEGFPSVLLESMSLGVPSISVDCESGPREIIAHGRNAWLVENETPALAAGIRYLIDHAETRESLGHHGREIIERFGWDKMVDRYETALARISSSTADAPSGANRTERPPGV
ncbi:glycosyltransferase family 4 protein [Roseiconus lacunae]|uniref:glycosyltransferase family 4 protein n=1 Tax=Roseiconus lacunae TaxID=2605694 RepID=UPI0011F0E82C|nr:glycosyltransferase family 4 protein [Roseiconus lacunae]